MYRVSFYRNEFESVEIYMFDDRVVVEATNGIKQTGRTIYTDDPETLLINTMINLAQRGFREETEI